MAIILEGIDLAQAIIDGMPINEELRSRVHWDLNFEAIEKEDGTGWTFRAIIERSQKKQCSTNTED